MEKRKRCGTLCSRLYCRRLLRRQRQEPADSDEAAPLFRDDCAPGFRDDLAPLFSGVCRR
ncbi:hypothetical protein GOL41_29900 [Sinorhizobium medicae]|nr:hypothetical protein [Sinorhizobium medicae]